MNAKTIEITEKNIELFSMLKEDGVLGNLDASLIQALMGFVLIFCSDCDHSDDVWEYFSGVLKKNNKPQRIFPVSRAGGAIWIPKDTYLLKQSGLPRDEDILFDVNVGLKLKDLTTIFTTIHAPCGAAGLYGLSLFDQIELLIESKVRLKQQYQCISNLEVKAFIQVCFPGQRRRTYFVSAQKWIEKSEYYKAFDYTPQRVFTTAS